MSAFDASLAQGESKPPRTKEMMDSLARIAPRDTGEDEKDYPPQPPGEVSEVSVEGVSAGQSGGK